MKNNVVIVSGGTYGIGYACVEKLSEAGYLVVFSGRDSNKGKEIAQNLQKTVFIQGDVSNPEDIELVVNEAMKIGKGKIAGLVNNAGMSMRKSFLETTLDDWDTIMRVNARSTYLFTRYSMKGLYAAKGSVVIMSSVAGKGGEEDLALYCASKAAVIGLAQALALECGRFIRVNTLCPGQISTRMMDKVLSSNQRRRSIEKSIPAGRIGTPEEIANAVFWLISPESSFVNGAVIPLDGGETAGIFKAK